MIITQLRGGLGNQLFQYSFSRVLASLLDTPLWLDTSFYGSKIGSGSYRQMGLLDWCVKVDRVLQYDSVFNVGRIRDEFGYMPLLRDEHGASLLGALELGSQIILQGEWSNDNRYLFSSRYKNLILSDLIPSREPSSPRFYEIKQMVIASPGPVFVHVRRGDYLRLTHVFQILQRDYYESGFDLIKEREINADFFVFSDNICEAQELLQSFERAFFVHGLTEIETFAIAKLCSHFICANSTFSWWAAYLGHTDKSIVILPRHYFSDLSMQNSYEHNSAYHADQWLRM